MASYIVPRPDKSEYAPFFERYVSLVRHANVVTALSAQLDDTVALLHTISANQALHRYEPGKWSIKEVVGHLIDCERVFSFRAHSFARGNPAPLPGFDENEYSRLAGYDRRGWGSIKDEFELVRRSSIALFGALEPEAWTRRGTAWENEVTVRALAYITAGHELHHLGVLRTRYLGRVDVE
jgi:hypothetical protein